MNRKDRRTAKKKDLKPDYEEATRLINKGITLEAWLDTINWEAYGLMVKKYQDGDGVKPEDILNMIDMYIRWFDKLQESNDKVKPPNVTGH